MKKDFMLALLPFWAEVITAEELRSMKRYSERQSDGAELRNYL